MPDQEMQDFWNGLQNGRGASPPTVPQPGVSAPDPPAGAEPAEQATQPTVTEEGVPELTETVGIEPPPPSPDVAPSPLRDAEMSAFWSTLRRPKPQNRIAKGITRLPGGVVRVAKTSIAGFKNLATAEGRKPLLEMLKGVLRVGARRDMAGMPIDEETKQGALDAIGGTEFVEQATLAMYQDFFEPFGVRMEDVGDSIDISIDPELALDTFAETPERLLENVSIVLGGATGAAAKLTKEGSRLQRALSISHRAAQVLDPIEATSELAKRVMFPAVKASGKATKATAIAGVSFLSGTPPPALHRAFDAPTPELLRAMRGKVEMPNILTAAREALFDMKHAAARRYQSRLAEMKNITKEVNFDPIFNGFDDILARYDIKRNPDMTLDFSASQFALDETFHRDMERLNDYLLERGTNPIDFTPYMLDRMKISIGNMYRESRNSHAAMTAMYGVIRDEIIKYVPEYAAMTKDFEEIQTFVSELNRTLSLEGGTDTAIGKLNSILRTRGEFRKMLLEELDAISGMDLSGQIAGVNLSQWQPRGVPAFFAVGGARITPWSLALIPLSSPRTLGETLTLLGMTNQQVKTAVRILTTNPKVQQIRKYLLAVEARQASFLAGRMTEAVKQVAVEE